MKKMRELKKNGGNEIKMGNRRKIGGKRIKIGGNEIKLGEMK
jgi:hypothetical protein